MSKVKPQKILFQENIKEIIFPYNVENILLNSELKTILKTKRELLGKELKDQIQLKNQLKHLRIELLQCKGIIKYQEASRKYIDTSDIIFEEDKEITELVTKAFNYDSNNNALYVLNDSLNVNENIFDNNSNDKRIHNINYIMNDHLYEKNYSFDSRKHFNYSMSVGKGIVPKLNLHKIISSRNRKINNSAEIYSSKSANFGPDEMSYVS